MIESILNVIEKIWSWMIYTRSFGVNFFAVFCVNITMEIIKVFKLKKFIKSELKLHGIMWGINLGFSLLFSFLFLPNGLKIKLFIQTIVLTLFISTALYEIVKSLKPLNILKEIIYQKLNKKE